MFVEQIVELLGKVAHFVAVGVLDAGCTNDGLEELTLQDDLEAGVDVIEADMTTNSDDEDKSDAAVPGQQDTVSTTSDSEAPSTIDRDATEQ